MPVVPIDELTDGACLHVIHFCNLICSLSMQKFVDLALPLGQRSKDPCRKRFRQKAKKKHRKRKDEQYDPLH